MTSRSRVAVLSLLAASVLMGADCGMDRPLVPDSPDGGALGGYLAGQVIKGRVAGATISVYRLNGAERGAQVATATTAEDGTFLLSVGASEGPFLVVATQGAYVDEATGASTQLNTEELTAVLPTFTVGQRAEGMLVTPISHFAAALTLREVREKQARVGDAAESAWFALNQHFGGLDWRRTVPTDVTTSSSTQLDAPAKAGLLLGALSQEAMGIATQAGLSPGTVNSLTLTQALYEDLAADGYFDGLGMAGKQLVLPSESVVGAYRLDDQTVRFALATALTSFLPNPRNTYRVTSADVQPMVQALSGSSGSLFRSAGGSFDKAPPAVTVKIRYTKADGTWTEAAPTTTPYVRGQVELTVDSSDESTVRSMHVTQEGASLRPAERGNTLTHFVGTWDASLAADGELAFTVESEDGRGNKGTTTYKVLVDNTAPTVTTNSPQALYYASDVRVESLSEDSGAGVVSFTASGLTGFEDDDAQAVPSIRGTWRLPSYLADGPATLTVKACDAVSNCTTKAVTFQVDRTPPTVTIAEAPARYTAESTVAFTVKALDAGAAVRAVKATRDGLAMEFSATELPSLAAGERLFRFEGLPLNERLNTLRVWAEDNTGNTSAAAPAVVLVSRDTQGPDGQQVTLAAYRDERTMGFPLNADKSPATPLTYTWPSGVVRESVSARVYKAQTRLSWGPTTPTAEVLEGDNPYNVPFLAFSAPRDVENEAPLKSATYYIDVACEKCGVMTQRVGGLLTAARSTPERFYYVLPLTKEIVPALENLPSSPATLNVRVVFADTLNNYKDVTTTVYFHVIGAPVSVVEDVDYAGRGDPQSDYHQTVASGRYGGMWGGTGGLRLRRFIIHNPADMAVPLEVGLTASEWSLTEDWDELFSSPSVDTWAQDGHTFQKVYTWVTSYYMNGTSNYPSYVCSTSNANSQSVQHSPGSSTKLECIAGINHSPGAIAPAWVAGGALAHAGYAGALPGANETATAPAWTSGYMVPAKGQLVLYVVRPRAPAPKSYVYQDRSNGRGYRIQWLNRDLWMNSGNGTFPCGSNGTTSAWCSTWTARRHTTELMSASQTFNGKLDLRTFGGTGGEATYSYGLNFNGGVSY